MNKTKNKENGFTLIEVLVAISILAFGLLAVASMQLAAIQANSSAIEITEALNAAQYKMEELIALPFFHADLNDRTADGNAGLDKPTRAEVIAAGDSLLPVGSPGQPDYSQVAFIGPRIYYLYWNVDVSSISNTKIIKVIVAWNERGMHKADLYYIKHP